MSTALQEAPKKPKPKKKRVERSYTPEQVEEGLWAVLRWGPTEAHRRTGFPETTLSLWTRSKPEGAARIRKALTREREEGFARAAREAGQELPLVMADLRLYSKEGTKDHGQRIRACGEYIRAAEVVDRVARLDRGDPTQIAEQRRAPVVVDARIGELCTSSTVLGWLTRQGDVIEGEVVEVEKPILNKE